MARVKKLSVTCDNECPNCESEAIEGDFITVESPYALQGLWCNICGATWTAMYKLVGYRSLQAED